MFDHICTVSNWICCVPYTSETQFVAMLRIHLNLMRMRIRILDPHWKKIDPVISLRCTKFLWQKSFSNFLFYFFAYFYPKPLWTIQKWGKLYNLSFFKKSDLGFRSKSFFYPLDPAPQNLADPTNPDPKQ